MNKNLKLFYKSTKSSFSTNKDNKKIPKRIIQYRRSITTALCSAILIKAHFTLTSFMFAGLSAIYFVKDGRHLKGIQTWIDNNFTESKNVRILFALEYIIVI